MKWSAVVLDLDGTFLNASKQVSERNLAAVLACFHSGMRIIIATARPPRAVRWFLPEQLQSIASFVYYNGAHVVCRHAVIEWHEAIPAPLSAEIIDCCLTLNPALELSMEVRDEWFSLREVDYSVAMSAKENPAVKSLAELKQYDATKLLLTGVIDTKQLQEKFGDQVNLITTDNGQLVQIMPMNASKEQAIAKLCEIHGIDIGAVIAFGDDYNDMGLFQACGYSVAMANAIPELKAFADEVTASNEQDGVALVLERYVAQHL